jgi:hypothetical protein
MSLNPNAETTDPLLRELGFKNVVVAGYGCSVAAQALKHITSDTESVGFVPEVRE